VLPTGIFCAFLGAIAQKCFVQIRTGRKRGLPNKAMEHTEVPRHDGCGQT
jgi:hypothetical protein